MQNAAHYVLFLANFVTRQRAGALFAERHTQAAMEQLSLRALWEMNVDLTTGKKRLKIQKDETKGTALAQRLKS